MRMLWGPHLTSQNDIGKEMHMMNRVRGTYQILFSLKELFSVKGSRFILHIFPTNYVVVLGRLISIQHKAKVLSVRIFQW